jgi:hypothetical protein
VLLVRRGDHRERVADGAVAETERRRVRDRRPEQRGEAVQPLGGELERTVVARCAHRAARSGVEGDDPLLGAALDAAPDVRQEPGEPEQLELEREDDRVVSGAPAGLGLALVERVEKAGRARNARSFCSSSVNSRSIASRPTSPTWRR